MSLVESGCINPGRAIELGCGTGANALYLAQKGFEYPMRWWEKFAPFYDVPFYFGEIEHRFGQYFEIEKIAGRIDYSKWTPGYAVYLMTRNGETAK